MALLQPAIVGGEGHPAYIQLVSVSHALEGGGGGDGRSEQDAFPPSLPSCDGDLCTCQVVDKAFALATYLYRNNPSVIGANMQRDLRDGNPSNPPGQSWWKKVNRVFDCSADWRFS